MTMSTRTRWIGGAAAALLLAGAAVAVHLATRGESPHAVAPARAASSDQVLYFLMADRFADGDPGNNTGGLGDDPLVSGFDPTDAGFYQGGDLAGVEQQLDYLQGLGVTGVWISPVLTNKAVQPEDSSAGYHGYWITDFTSVDPHLGGDEALDSLVDAAHERGMKVFLDIITNHTADVIGYEGGDRLPYVAKDAQPYVDADGEAFDDTAAAATGGFPEVTASSFPHAPVLAAGEEEAKSPAWLNDVTMYHNRGNTTFTGEDSQYGDFFGLDDLWTENPQVVDGMTAIYADWIDAGIDGYRIDTVRHVDDAFWESFIPGVLEAARDKGKDDFFVFGEVYDGSRAFTSRYTTEVGLQAVLDFPFQGAARAFASGSGRATDLATFFAADDWYTDADSSATQLPTFLGNHDMGRFGSMLLEDNPAADAAELLARDELAHALLLLSRGNPIVYYGDEQGLTGEGGDKAARQPLFGTSIPEYLDDTLIGSSATLADPVLDTAQPLYRWIAELSALRTSTPALTTGAQITRVAEDARGVYAFSRIDREERREVVVAVNSAAEPRAVEIPTWTRGGFTRLVGEGDDAVVADDEGVVMVTVPAFGTLVYQADSTMVEGSDIGVTLAAGAVETAGESDPGRLGASASVDCDCYAEVSFWARAAGGSWEHLGTDDAAPYQVMDVVSDLAPGEEVEYVAVASDGLGHESRSGTVVQTVPDPTVTLDLAAGDSVGVDPLISATVAPARADTSVVIERKVGSGGWTEVGTDTTAPVYGVVDDLAAVEAGADVLYRARATQGAATVESSTLALKAAGSAGAGTPSLPGSFNELMGCAEWWQPDCEAAVMTFDEAASTWRITVDLPAGRHEYKVAIDGAWDENYGDGGVGDGPNMVLELDAPATVTFTYDPITHLTTAEVG
ncbi:alpha-amylase family glycosyl hydrolase [Demequina sp. SYSU T00039]|uniref:Alpha-amylase family glycosyl hydrolase n=1 Tax=Demequina lignilytica TaxID=3051663 RepID=A0AAW7M6E7_9MICO|nr:MULTISPECIES: alpha-amylase family glycosyl hydrolase [unclassified Demequina]MDN4479058.1 alpha-amylase family glycosyl hydrolase [Demequina sp. SYSU T00039-1]MDN4489023.1 alpha-amylase family glycosyl hydrolase [Demequina sp. SYSU T00039]